jgi:hypothetical protein
MTSPRKKGQISKRLCEHFVKNYLKRHRVTVKRQGSDEDVILYELYQNVKGANRKKEFDMFCRTDHITIQRFGVTVTGTPATFNFMKFLIESGALEYLEQHIDEVWEDRKQFDKTRKGYTTCSPCDSDDDCDIADTMGSITNDTAHITTTTNHNLRDAVVPKDGDYAFLDPGTTPSGGGASQAEVPAKRKRGRPRGTASRLPPSLKPHAHINVERPFGEIDIKNTGFYMTKRDEGMPSNWVSTKRCRVDL